MTKQQTSTMNKKCAPIFLCLCFVSLLPVFGQLQFQQFIADGEGSLFLEGCQESVLTANGVNLYVASMDNDAVVHFERNTATGELTFQNAYMDAGNGGDLLEGASGLVLSENGENLYVIAYEDQSISRFSINGIGELTLEQTLSYTGVIDGLRSPIDVTISPDGLHLYVVSDAFDSMSAFGLEAGTGAMSWMGNYENNVNGILNFDRPHTVLVSPDGQQIYVTCESYNGVVAFNRNALDGTLTYLDAYKPTGFGNLHYATSMEMSSDGFFIYVAFPDGIYKYDRNIADGTLTETEFFELPDIGNVLIRDVLVLNEDAGLLYAVQRFSNKLTVFEYDLGDGHLAETATVQNGQNGVEGLANTNSILLSPDNNQVYSCARNGNNFVIGHFDLPGDGVPEYVDSQEDMGLTVDGLNEGYHAKISPDERFLYVSGSADDAIAIFEIDMMDGRLTYTGKVQNGLNGTQGLEGVRSTEISPDGEHLYATGSGDNSLVVFDRNVFTGQLTYKTKYTESSGGAFYGLLGCYEAKISDDGQFLYVVSLFRHALLVFNRNPFTGELTFIQIMEDGIDGVDGLNFATALRISDDQNHIYITGSGDDAIAIFSRNISTGFVTQTGVVFNNQNGVTGLDYPARLALNPDDNYLYVAARNSNSLAVFQRDILTGNLTFQQAIFDNQNGVNGIEDAYAIAVSPDGKQVYASGEGDQSLAIFNRDNATGMLDFIGFLDNDTAENEGVENVIDIQISADNRFVFTIDEDGDGVAVYYNCSLENLEIMAGDSVELSCAIPTEFLMANASMGGNITYEWTTQDGDILNGNNTLNPEIGTAGNYVLTLVSQPFGCTLSDSVFVTEIPNNLTATATATPTINDEENGTAVVTPMDGIAPYTYLWNTTPPITDSLATGLVEGIYSVTVTDANECEFVLEVEVGMIVGTTESLLFSALKIFPNPVADKLTIDWQLFDYQEVEVSFFNVLGQNVWSENFKENNHNFQIEVKDWQAGVYYCQFKIGKNILVKKVIVE